MTVKRKDLNRYLRDLLEIYSFQDYGPNGLQIEGKENIKTIAFAVSACRETIEAAVSAKADCLITHHGLIWQFHGTKTLTGAYAKRIFPLIKNDINFFGYHLPLDAHPEIGNAAMIGHQLGLEETDSFGDHKGMPTGIKGRFPEPIGVIELQQKLEKILSHEVILSSADHDAKIRQIGILTGGAGGDWYRAQKDNLDAYLTGEISEHTWHEAQEGDIHLYAGGHYATEQFGIQGLMGKIQEKFKKEKLNCFFIPTDNPV